MNSHDRCDRTLGRCMDMSDRWLVRAHEAEQERDRLRAAVIAYFFHGYSSQRSREAALWTVVDARNPFPAPTTPATPVSPAHGDLGRHSEGQER